MVYLINVTPCVGVWIETGHTLTYDCGAESHPAWVCGLKLSPKNEHHFLGGHTLRGCVD